MSLKIARVSHISLLGGMLYFYVVSNLVAEGLEDGVLARQCEWANISMFVITFDIYELTQLYVPGSYSCAILLLTSLLLRSL